MQITNTKSRYLSTTALAIILLLPTSRLDASVFDVVVEDALNQNSTASFTSKLVIDFEDFLPSLTPDNRQFEFEDLSNTVTVESVVVSAGGLYGGALIGDSPSNFAVISNGGASTPVSITSATKLNYFGLYVSALSSGNIITFFDGGTQIATYDTEAIDTLIGSNASYLGSSIDDDYTSAEKFAFLNFYSVDERAVFNHVVLSGGGFESDNWTFGTFTERNTGGLALVTSRDINAGGEALDGLVDLDGSLLNSVFDGGELVIDRNVSAGQVASFTIKAANGNARLRVDGAGVFELGSTFGDATGSAGVLEKTGTGTLRLANTGNSHSGGTVVTQGVLAVGADGALGALGAGIGLNGGTLRAEEGFTSARAVAVSNASRLDVVSGQELVLSGVISGGGAFEKTGTGTLRLANTGNSHSGGTVVTQGVLAVGADGALGALGAGIGLNGGTLRAEEGFNTSRAVTVTANSSLDVADEELLVLNGAMTGTAELTKTGDGAVWLNVASTFDGTVRVSDGILRVRHDEALGGTTLGVLVEDGATLEFGDNTAIGSEPITIAGQGHAGQGAIHSTAGLNSLAGPVFLSDDASIRNSASSLLSLSGSIDLGAHEATFQAVGDDVDVTGPILGLGSIRKTGTHRLRLSGTNIHEGGTTVTEGILEIASGAALGAASGALDLAGGTLRMTGVGTAEHDVRITATSEIEVVSGSQLRLLGTLTGDAGAALRKTGNGVLVLDGSGPSTAGEVVVEAGTLYLDTAANLTGTTLTNEASSALRGALTLSDTLDNSGALNLDGASIDAAHGVTSTGSINVSGDETTVTGAVTVTGSTATLSIGTKLSIDGDLDHASTRADLLSGEKNLGTMFTFAGAELSVSGALTNRNRFFIDAASVVSANTLANLAPATIDLRAGATLSVASGLTNEGRLSGTGTVAGDLSSSGVVAPGNSPGTLTVAGDVTFSSGNRFEVELDGLAYDVAGGAGSYDRLAITGETSTFSANGTIAPLLMDDITDPANNDFLPGLGNAFTVVTTQNSSGIIATSEFTAVAQPLNRRENTRFDVLYHADHIDLVVTPESYAALFAPKGAPNVVAAATALDSMRPVAGPRPDGASGRLFAGLYGLEPTALLSALSTLSGDVHAIAVNDVRDGVRGLAGSARLDGTAPQTDGESFWVDLSGSRISYDGDTAGRAYEADGGNLWIGLDLEQRADLRYGLALGHGQSSVDAQAAGQAESQAVMLMGYYSARIGENVEVGAKLGIGRASLGTERSVGLGFGTEVATGQGDATVAFAEVDIAHNHDLGAGFGGQFWGSVAAEYTEAGGYSETGSEAIGLAVAGESYRSATVTVGYNLSADLGRWGLEGGRLALGVGVKHDFGPNPYSGRTVSMHGADWDVATREIAPTSGFVSLQAGFAAGENARLSVYAAGQGNADRTSFNAGLRFTKRF